MKFNFDNYVYFGAERQNKDYEFNPDIFNEFVNNRQYEQAADYAANFHFKDPRIQAKHESEIINLRRNGKILGKVYGNITDPEELAKVEFADAVFNDGGLEKINHYTTNEQTKEYAKQFAIAKAALGSYYENGELKNEATHLELTFAPQKQTLFGADWLDWMVPDNGNNIENFFYNSGLDKQQLEQAGVQVIQKDGSTTLKFAKDNPLANKILYYTPTQYDSFNETVNPVAGLYKSIIPGDQNKWSKGVVVRGYKIKNGEEEDVYSHLGVTNYYHDLVENALESKNNIFKERDLDKKDFSSTVGPALSDELEALNRAYNEGEIDDTAYNKEYKRVAGWMYDVLQGLGSGDYQFYSNYANDEPTDETLVEMNNEQRGELMNFITGVNPKRMHLLSMVSNGKIGTLIVVDGLKNEKGENDTDITSAYKSRRRMIFVPGLFQEQAQEKINRNTSTRAIQEYNDMQTWGYDYDFVDGSKLSFDKLGNLVRDGRFIEKNDAIREINKDMIMRELGNNLKYSYLNNNDEIIDFDAYETIAKKAAIKAANELRPETPLVKKDGVTPYTIDEIFDYAASPDDEELLNEKAVSELQYQQYDKVKDIFDIYNYILKGTSYYKY